jgi:hypothetical protein
MFVNRAAVVAAVVKGFGCALCCVLDLGGFDGSWVSNAYDSGGSSSNLAQQHAMVFVVFRTFAASMAAG